MRVAAYTKYDRDAASTRQRILQYIPALHAAGIELDHRPLLPDWYMGSLVRGRRISRADLVARYARRAGELFSGSPGADLIWVHSELFPYLPAALENRVFRNGLPVVYDWDDAVFVPYVQHRNTLVSKMLGQKFPTVLRRAAATTCGNAFLRDYCAQYCPTSLIIPTTVDTDVYRPLKQPPAHKGLILGWIGSPTTWADVRPLLPLIQRFCTKKNATFRAIGTGIDARADHFPALEFVDWDETTEVTEVQNFDIGIMPLIDGPFQRGKCGFKLIQYMACGVAAVGSPVGVNSDIISNDENGFLVNTEEDWYSALTRLADEPSLRRRIGQAGRERVLQAYSLQAQAPKLIELFRKLSELRS